MYAGNLKLAHYSLFNSINVQKANITYEREKIQSRQVQREVCLF